MATLRPVAALRGAPGAARLAAPRAAARGLACARAGAAPLRPRAPPLRAVPGMDSLPPPGSADITLFSPSKARIAARSAAEMACGTEAALTGCAFAAALRCAAARQVNLFLRIVRRREDGFHDLASLFHVRPSAAQRACGHAHRRMRFAATHAAPTPAHALTRCARR